MGAMGSKVSRNTVQKFNAENRAHKVIEKAQSQKPIPAPRHPSTVEPLKKLESEHPEWLKEQKSKHEGLNERLRGMIVDPARFGELKTSRALPENRAQVENPEFGYLEPTHIRPGHFSIKQSLEFISMHVQDPDVNTPDKIATQYKLDAQNARDVLRYFTTFQMQLPKELAEQLGPGEGANESLLRRPDTRKLLTDKPSES